MRRFALPAIVLLGLLLRILYAAAIYEPTLAVYHGGDYELYRIGAEILSRGDFSFTNDVFLLRPPFFPLLMAALDLQPLLILAINILLSSGIIALTYALTRKLGPMKNAEAAALLSALLVALDPASIRYSALLLAEPLANLSFAIILICLLALRRAASRPGLCLWSALAGAAIALSALARPAAELLWIPFALWIFLVRADRRLISAGIFTLAAAIGTGGWRLHNANTFGHSAYTTLGNWNLLYKRAASVLHHGADLPIEDTLVELARRVEAKLGNALDGVDINRPHHHYVGSPQLQSAMTEVATDIFRAYPLEYIATTLAGLYRQLLDTLGPLRLPGIGWSLALLAAAAFGLLLWLGEKRWGDIAIIALPCAWYLLGSLVYCTACSSGRDRATVMPLLAIMAAHGILHLINRRRAASANPAGPA